MSQHIWNSLSWVLLFWVNTFKTVNKYWEIVRTLCGSSANTKNYNSLYFKFEIVGTKEV